jgi:hypothetical protein
MPEPKYRHPVTKQLGGLLGTDHTHSLLVRVLESNINSRLCLPVSSFQAKDYKLHGPRAKGLTCGFNPHIRPFCSYGSLAKTSEVRS